MTDKNYIVDADTILTAERISIGACGPKCTCQQVHVLFIDIDGDVFATASFDAQFAREIAAELLVNADEADLRLARLAGRVS
tara:strand:+ start:341 stop:586 length:246 start_codon:yes stop_codon:yes gene_type:complete